MDNLTAILDYNGLQQYGWQRENGLILTPIENPSSKWEAFGWNAIETDGHDMPGFIGAVEQAGNMKDRPTIIIAHTRKGKGVGFIEGRPEWHARAPNDAELAEALAELGQSDLMPLKD